MALTLGTTVGPCSVTAKIDQGGLGEVYRKGNEVRWLASNAQKRTP